MDGTDEFRPLAVGFAPPLNLGGPRSSSTATTTHHHGAPSTTTTTTSIGNRFSASIVPSDLPMMSDSPPQVGAADSIDSRDSDVTAPEKKKSRRPANTAFRQQRLKAWQPILTPKTVLPLFFTIGIIFAPIGGLLLYASSQVQELRLDYTNCDESPLVDSGSRSDFEAMSGDDVSFAFKTSNVESNAGAMWAHSNLTETYQGVNYTDAITCHIQFEIPESMGPPVLMYYHLTNFYQNHRRYVASFSEKQLKGDALSGSAVNSSGCTPLTSDDDGKPYYPCGLIANSIFNDTIESPLNLQQNTSYDMGTSNIAWSSDKDLYGNTEYKHDEVSPPPNWAARYPKGYQEGDMPDISNDEAFMVWMRTAGLPEFSKLSRRNDDNAMEQGTYQLDIISRFPTKEYRGTKSIVLSTRTVMGGRNPFLGIAYVVVGGICIILGAIFTVTHLIKPRKLGDHTYLSWNNAPAGKTAAAGPSTGIATGREIRPGDVA
ncbi:Meiotically up-regulated protein [Zalerion maritima]|uniref:Meiotically up-regulated protein n=1 Tax=Zalerion maritima TaxID=339359 RepID=A0AAD5WTV3_9PEZI|nr:Meiotically up-regulated protein [Zalerion maritima]